MNNKFNKYISILLFITLLLPLLPADTKAATNCAAPAEYSVKAKEYIEYYNIPLKDSKGRALNEAFLLNTKGIGSSVIVYGCPSDIDKDIQDLKKGQYRYLGWDNEGNLYRNWKFESDSNMTKSVAKNWVKKPWNTPVGEAKRIQRTLLSDHPDINKWLTEMADPYGHTETFLQSYNKLKGTNWTADILWEYVVVQQARTKFSPGVVQMWNIWQPDGSWWYEVFTIPAEPLPPPPSKPDLEISQIVNPADAWVGDSVPIKITTKNNSTKASSGAFTVGIVGTNIKSEVISNVPPGQIKTVTVNVSSTTSGIKTFKAKTDFGEAVDESNEQNNTKDFKIAFNKKNEPTTPIAIISHKEGDHRTEPKVTIKPSVDPKLDDKLSYSPGKEAITVREWKYKTPAGKTIVKKPLANDFTAEGEYLVELRVTNTAKKVSEWAQLVVNVATKATPNPSASPTPTPEPTPTPKPELKVNIRFQPDEIIVGETSSLLNGSSGFESYEWRFSENLDPLLTDKNKYEYYNQLFTQPGTYQATITASDGVGKASDTATLKVIDPKPIAIVAGPTRLIEGRPLPVPYHLNNSYTPLEDRGVTIDHSRDEKRYKKVGDTSYTVNFPTENNLAIGQYSLEGKVYDTTNRVSDWANLIVDVVPDLPPTIQVISPDETYRQNGFMLYMEAESPDADLLTHLLLEERYDRNGNGNFEEEAWTTLYDGTFKNTHALNYATVGKRQYRATVTEDYGKKGISPLASTDVLNYTPTVNFNVFGTTTQPGQGEDSGPPVINYTPESIFRSWVLKKPYTGGNEDKIGWKVDGSAIRTKNAEFAKFISSFPDAGMGANSRNKYPLASDLVAKPRWVTNVNSNDSYVIIPKIFNYNRMYLSTDVNGVLHYSERNAENGQELRRFSLSGHTFQDDTPELEDDERFYTLNVSDKINAKIKIYNNRGELIDTHTFGLITPESGRILNRSNIFKLLPDGKTVLVKLAYSDRNYGNTEYKYYKYSYESRSLQWVSSGSISTTSSPYYYDQTTYTTVSSDGTIYDSSGGKIVKLSPNGSRLESAQLQGAQDTSPVSISNDGQFLYVKNIAYSSGDYAKNNFHTLRASDLSLVNTFTGLLQYPKWGRSYIYDESPMVREDGVVVIVEDYTVYYFSSTGHLIHSDSNVNNGPNYKFGTPSHMTNGDLLFPAYHMHDLYRNLLYNYSKSSVIATEPVDKYWTVNTGIGLVTSTPVLPNGSMFLFDMKSNPNTVQPFVSASGNKGGIQGINPDTISILNDNWGGLFYDATSSNKNYAFEFNVSVNDINNAKTVGAAFQIQNEQNMFAAEWTNSTLALYRVVNGSKTLLQSTALARNAYVNYPFKVESINGIQRVYVNHTKVLEVQDGTYVRGYAGIMSLGQPNANYSSVKKTNYGDTYTQQTYDTVLVNEPITYEKLFNDIEKDPMGVEEWSYSHNPNFFENPEGLSIYNGNTYGSTINALERAGVYEISFRAKDNPGLAAYSKWSEPVKKLLYVHRRPVAQPDVRFTGRVFSEGEALDYDTHDKSFDPDIAHILSDKVFRTRYADQSTWTAGKREYYNRPGVELIVQEQVKDIHGAWSYWGQTIVYRDALPPVNQTKPVMTITYPTGSTPASPTMLIKEPTIRWTYYDAQNDPQERYRLMLTYVDNNETALYIEHEGNTLTYPMIEGSIVPGRVVKVQGQVYSTGVWSNESNIRYFMLDLPPQTYLLTYNGPDANNPIYTNFNRPKLDVFTVDPENHPITAIDYEVFKASSGSQVVDTNSATASASYTPAALTEGLHYWKARANDGYLWGPYSSNGFFFVDTVKPADVNEQLSIEPTAVTVNFNAFSDAEPSSGHLSRIFYLQKVNADGSISNIDLNGDGSTEYSIPLALTKQSHRVTGLVSGQEYRVTVLDYDIAGNEGHYAYIHFSTNRPPVADFDWTPKPKIWEGDTIKFNNLSSDPDGDPLIYNWTIVNPNGVSSTSISIHPQIPNAIKGTYRVTLKVTDQPGGLTDTISKNIIVNANELSAININHIPKWIKYFNDNSLNLSTFLAGEPFQVTAKTSENTSKVTVHFAFGDADKPVPIQFLYDKNDDRYPSFAHTFNLLDSTNKTQWSLEAWRKYWIQIPDGTYVATVKATYNNGTSLMQNINIVIKDHIWYNVKEGNSNSG